jgi:hypothetical protein
MDVQAPVRGEIEELGSQDSAVGGDDDEVRLVPLDGAHKIRLVRVDRLEYGNP